MTDDDRNTRRNAPVQPIGDDTTICTECEGYTWPLSREPGQPKIDACLHCGQTYEVRTAQ